MLLAGIVETQYRNFLFLHINALPTKERGNTCVCCCFRMGQIPLSYCWCLLSWNLKEIWNAPSEDFFWLLLINIQN